MWRVVGGNKCRSLDKIPTDLDNLEAKMLQCLPKLIFESSVMPKYFTESLVSTVLLLIVTSMFGEGLEILGGIIKIDDFCGLTVILFAVAHRRT